ncbi:glycosyl transferase [Pilobolus umbonatus]|nr:glycosyl transferase [Pilobolus umbonatus]
MKSEKKKDSTPSLFRFSPVRRLLQTLVQKQLLWTAPIIILLFAFFVRWAVALNVYSGYNSPPMYGDYEAQRHWMEITLHLPVSSWYRYDLDWWGLDYPPLTAYHSWICGYIGSKINASWFALDTSRGIESLNSQLYMRSTVFVSELLIYIPAVLIYCQIVYGSSGYLKKYMAATLILMQPALIMIDHGHFQYNCIMLGLTLLAINCFLTELHVFGAILFCAALGFKQMALYYAPAIFAYLFGRCFVEPEGIALFFKLGMAVLATFIWIFIPFISPIENLEQVISRIFPVARGLYEDKVANIWCALNVFVKLKQLLTIEETLKLSLFATLLFVIPVSIHLIMSPTRKRFIYALINSSLAFYLFSFQVHEKSILLPLLPVTLSILEEPIASTLFVNVSMFSLFPLLKREGLVMPYYLTSIFWNWLVGGYGSNVCLNARIRIWGVYIAFIMWHIAEEFIAPPANLPDLFTVINVLISCALFLSLLMYFLYCQLIHSSPTPSAEKSIKKTQ